MNALAFQKMLENYLRFDKDMIEIIPIRIVHQKDLTKMIENIKKERNIICIVMQTCQETNFLACLFNEHLEFVLVFLLADVSLYAHLHTYFHSLLHKQGLVSSSLATTLLNLHSLIHPLQSPYQH